MRRIINEGFFSTILGFLKSVYNQFKSNLDYNKPGSPLSLYCLDSIKSIETDMNEFGDNVNKAKKDKCIADDVYDICAEFLNSYGQFTKKLNEALGPLVDEFNASQEQTTDQNPENANTSTTEPTAEGLDLRI